MKILYLTPGCFDKGGISRYCRYQIGALRELVGSENIRTLSLLGPSSNDFEEPFETTYYAGGATNRHKLSFAARTVYEATRFQPDLIWAAHIHLSPVAQAVSKILRCETIVNTYGRELWSHLRPRVRWGIQTADHVLSDCYFTASYMEERGLRKPNTTHVIWDCVDTERFKPGNPAPKNLEAYKLPAAGSSINLVTLGRIHQSTSYKGYLRLLTVFERLYSRCPSLHLIYCGSGDLLPELRRLAEAANIADRVHFTGSIAEESLADIYRSAYIFYLVGDRGPERGEGIPLTPLEAAASGVPVLVGNQDGSKEVVEDRVTGFALDPFDIESHASTIERLVNDVDLYGRMATAARARSEELFSYEGFREKHRVLLDRLAQ